MQLLGEHGLWLATKSQDGESSAFNGACKEFTPDPQLRFQGDKQHPIALPVPIPSPSPPTTDASEVKPGDEDQSSPHDIYFQDSLFESSVHRAAGVFASSDLQQQQLQQQLRGSNSNSNSSAGSSSSSAQDYQRTIIVTVCDEAYAAHLNNFHCFLTRLGLKYMAVIIHEQSDSQSHESILKETQLDGMLAYHIKLNATASISSTSSVVGGAVPSAAAAGSHPHNVHLSKAFQFVLLRRIVGLGFNVLYADVDAIFVRNPLSLIQLPTVDIAYGVTAKCSVSPLQHPHEADVDFGLIFFKSNSKSKRVLNALITHTIDDGKPFGKSIKSIVHPIATISLRNCSDISTSIEPINQLTNDLVVLCPLDSCQFSSSMHALEDLYQTLYIRNQRVYTIHPSHLKGSHNKIRHLERHGLWLPLQTELQHHFSECNTATELP